MCQLDCFLASLLSIYARPQIDVAGLQNTRGISPELGESGWNTSSWFFPATAMPDLGLGSLLDDLAGIQRESDSLYKRILSAFGDIDRRISTGIRAITSSLGPFAVSSDVSTDLAPFNYASAAATNPVLVGSKIRCHAPLNGEFTISSLFRERRSGGKGHPFGRLHQGVDIAAPDGTPILAVANAVVVYSGNLDGYGKTVILQHGDPQRPASLRRTLYAHCGSLNVSTNEVVRKGKVIAKVGHSGKGTGPHLHFEFAKVSASGGMGERLPPLAMLRRNHLIDIL